MDDLSSKLRQLAMLLAGVARCPVPGVCSKGCCSAQKLHHSKHCSLRQLAHGVSSELSDSATQQLSGRQGHRTVCASRFDYHIKELMRCWLLAAYSYSPAESRS